MRNANGYFGGKGWSWDDENLKTLAQVQNTGKEKQGVEADPQFVAPERGDFRLRKTSPMRGAGLWFGAPVLDLTGLRRPPGKGCDLGAFGQPEE